MNNQSLVGKNKHCVVEAASAHNSLRLALSLAGELTSNRVARFADDAVVSVQGADELASTYRPYNWIVGVMSGALYAFRALLMTRQQVVVTELSGHLGSLDMDAIANCAALAVAKLADRDPPALELGTWQVNVQVTERPPATSSKRSQDDHVASPRVEGVPLPPPISAASA